MVAVEGLDDVIGNFGANGLFHDVFLLAFGNHHHGQIGPLLLDLRQRFEARHAGHHFIQKYQIEAFVFYFIEGIRAAVYGGHVVAFFGQKQNMWLQKVNFVISPEDFILHGIEFLGE